MLQPNKWYGGVELAEVWGVSLTERTGIVAHLVKRGMMRRRGNTSKVQYWLIPEKSWNWRDLKKEENISVGDYKNPKPIIEKTGNGVVTVKLRKEANLPATTSALENLITAATTLGTDNEILRGKLIRIRAILEEV